MTYPAIGIITENAVFKFRNLIEKYRKIISKIISPIKIGKL